MQNHALIKKNTIVLILWNCILNSRLLYGQVPGKGKIYESPLKLIEYEECMQTYQRNLPALRLTSG